MTRVYEDRDLTQDEATISAKECHDDLPPPISVQIIPQADGRFSVISVYADEI